MRNFVDQLSKSKSFHSGKGVTQDVIEAAEEELNLMFSDEYKKYVLMYGKASIYGHEFTGLGIKGPLNVVEATKYQRSKNPNIPGDYYIVEELHIDDMAIWQNRSGEVFQSYGDGTYEKMFDSLSDLIEEDMKDSPEIEKPKKGFFFRKK